MTKGQKITFRILFFLYLAGILFLCFGHFKSLPSAPTAILGIPADKLMHFAMFLPFPILAFLAFDQYTKTIPQTLAFVGVTLAVGLVVAALTEWGQAILTDYRSGDFLDFLADSTGLLISSGIVTFWDFRKQAK